MIRLLFKEIGPLCNDGKSTLSLIVQQKAITGEASARSIRHCWSNYFLQDMIRVVMTLQDGLSVNQETSNFEFIKPVSQSDLIINLKLSN